MSPEPDTLWSVLRESAERHTGRAAILAPGREPLSYAELAGLIERVAGQLRALGIDQQARVAVVLANGPEMATAFAALSAACVCAPLNPAFTRRDFDFYLRDLGARALLVDEDSNTPAIAAAEALGIRVLRIRKQPQAGAFELVDPIRPVRADWPAEHCTALLLHTSGTTAKPKLAPLTGRNLSASARHIAETLSLCSEDRCLNIMPLFHIHGLMAAVLASLVSGASVVCTDGVYGGDFFAWMRAFRPTWYTAVPTMHQSILARADSHREIIRDRPLRLIRSSSAALAPGILAGLEEAFESPVIESYGMTEAAHQMTSNRLPPGRRKPGSVGLPAGPEIAILAPSGEILPAGATGEVGEVVLRGPNVMAAYEGNDRANAEAFHDGWFRTGDLGSMDGDGYLFLTGRLKEIINRGGEKISPREVDEVLLGHPGVRQALCFAIPHAQLGEEVGAAVELKPGAVLLGSELRAWAGERLPAFKAPRVIRVLDEIPRGPTGKLQRIGLAARIGIAGLDDLRSDADFTPPRTPTEERIAKIWSRLFPGRPIGVKTRFEALGGDSLLTVKMLAEVSAAAGFNVPYLHFVEEGTIEALAGAVDAGCQTDSPLVALQPEGGRSPLYCVPGHDGNLLNLTRLASALSSDQPVWAFDLRKIQAPSSVEQLATQCVDLLLARDSRGPYRLAGVCFGGVLAAEMARQLESRGKPVCFLALIDSLNPAWKLGLAPSANARARIAQLRAKTRYHVSQLRTLNYSGRLRYLAERVAAFFRNHGETAGSFLGRSTYSTRNRRAALRHTPRPVAARALVIRVFGRRPHAAALGWRGIFPNGIISTDLPFNPHGALAESSVGRVAEILSEQMV